MPEQKFHIIHIDPSVITCKDADVKAQKCPACHFDGKLPVLKDGTPLHFPKGFVSEFETELTREETDTKIIITYLQNMHCPACGFWDRTSIKKKTEVQKGAK